MLDLDGDNYSTENQPQQDETKFYITDCYDEYNLGQGDDELLQEFGDWGNQGYVVNGEEGNDTITSFSYATELNGNGGDDFIRGMVTNTIHGNEGNDILQLELDQDLNDTSGGGAWGDEGNDTLRVYSDIFDLPDYSSGALKGVRDRTHSKSS